MKRKASNVKVKNSGKARKILFLAGPGTQILDVAGPFQIFVRAAEILQRKFADRPPAYDPKLVSIAEKTIRTSSGLKIVAENNYLSHQGKIDTLLIAGGNAIES